MQIMIFKAAASYESYFELLKLKKENKYDGVVKEPDYTKTKFFPFSFSYIGSRYENGKRLKSMNQYFNKKLSYLHKTNPYVLRGKVDPVFNELRYVKDLKTNLAYKESFKHYTTKRMLRLYEKRDNKINDYIYKACNMVINYCLNNNVTTIVLGYNKAFQVLGFKYPDNYELLSNIKKHYIKNIVQENNQKFNTIPFGKIKNRLNYLSNLHGINFIIQEESYTSDSSFFYGDDIPIYKKEDTNVYTF